MKWSKEAEEAVKRVPFFVRKMVRKRVEDEASSHGATEVTIEDVRNCKKRYLNNMEDEVKGYQVETCFGASGCPNRAIDDSAMAERVEALLEKKNLKAFFKTKVKGQLKMHHEFRVSISDCPNACSRPQITDIGLIGACRPEKSQEPCSGCGACVEACRENAITLNEDGPVIDFEKCLSCGKCISACPTGTLKAVKKGWRILVGGKLGRHPQFGRELNGVFSTDAAVAAIESCVEFYMRHNIEGERFGEVINREGLDGFELKK